MAMYNRYRGNSGRPEKVAEPKEQNRRPPPPPQPPRQPPKQEKIPESRFLDRLLGKLHLGDVDSGDLLLLLILFFLFKEEADEELLIAIGLLLIL